MFHTALLCDFIGTKAEHVAAAYVFRRQQPWLSATGGLANGWEGPTGDILLSAVEVPKQIHMLRSQGCLDVAHRAPSRGPFRRSDNDVVR